VFARDDLEEADVGTADKAGVIFHGRPEAVHAGRCDVVHADHRMRVAHRDGADRERLIGHLEGVERRFRRRVEGEGSGGEIRSSHGHRHGAIGVRSGGDEARWAVHPEFLADAVEAASDQRRDAAGAVAALFDLPPVRVENSVVHRGAFAARRLEGERLIETDPEVAVGERGERRPIGGAGGTRIEDDEVVAETVHLREGQGHARIIADGPMRCRWPVCSAAGRMPLLLPVTLMKPVPRVGFVSLGCPKALVDSERILTQLRAEGYEIAPSYAGADLVVVNTCGFIDSAVDESLDSIGEALRENGRVLVTGCLGAQPERIRERHPEVLGISGPHDYEAVMKAVHAELPRPHDPFLDLVPPQGVRLTPRHYAYLKISEGCNHRCSFCIIPSMRGDLVSRPLAEVLNEGVRLLNAGVRELLVISQDTSAYGVDRRYESVNIAGRAVETRFLDLVRELGTLARDREAWVRLHYVYPYPHVDAVIPLMQEGFVLPYLDIPFQHASPRILKLMKRPAHAENTLARIHAWRASLPKLAIRSTFIVGFPGETDAEFEQLLDWLEAAELDRVGCFTYSPVEGAAANALPDPVPEDVKQERQARFMERAAVISARRLAARVGGRERVLVDAVGKEGRRNVAVARSYADAPEIDGTVRIVGRGVASLVSGQFADVRISAAGTYDLEATLV